jgi:hypothetical protein
MAIFVGTYHRNIANLGLFFGKNALKKLLLINVRSFFGSKIRNVKRKTRTQVKTKFLKSKHGKDSPQKALPPTSSRFKKKYKYDTHAKPGSCQGSPTLVSSPIICPV